MEARIRQLEAHARGRRDRRGATGGDERRGRLGRRPSATRATTTTSSATSSAPSRSARDELDVISPGLAARRRPCSATGRATRSTTRRPPAPRSRSRSSSRRGWPAGRRRADSAAPPGCPPGRPRRAARAGHARSSASSPARRARPRVLLLHGWTATADLNWFPCLRARSAERFRRASPSTTAATAAASAPAGASAWPTAPTTSPPLLDVLGIDRVIAVGYSMGGPVAQLLVAPPPRARSPGWCCAPPAATSSATASERRRGCRSSAAMARAPSRRHDGAGAAGGSVVGRPPWATARSPRWAAAEIRPHDCRGHALEAGRRPRALHRRREWIGDVDVPTAVVRHRRATTLVPARAASAGWPTPSPAPPCTPSHGDHGACVAGPQRFVPALVGGVRRRWPRAPSSRPQLTPRDAARDSRSVTGRRPGPRRRASRPRP